MRLLHDACQDSYETPTGLLQHSHRTSAKRLQHIYRMLVSKMIEYSSFLLQCTSVSSFGVTTCYLYFQMKTLLKMAEASINNLLPGVPYNPPKSEMKRQKLIECVLSGNRKQYLVKAYTIEQVNELSAKGVDKLFSNYKVKLSRQMVKSLGKSIIRLCHVRNEQSGHIEQRPGA